MILHLVMVSMEGIKAEPVYTAFNKEEAENFVTGAQKNHPMLTYEVVTKRLVDTEEETYYVVYDDMDEEIIHITTSPSYCRMYIEDWLERNDEISLDLKTGEYRDGGESKIDDCMAGDSWGVSMRTYTGIIKREA